MKQKTPSHVIFLRKLCRLIIKSYSTFKKNGLYEKNYSVNPSFTISELASKTKFTERQVINFCKSLNNSGLLHCVFHSHNEVLILPPWCETKGLKELIESEVNIKN